jgi:hypothetical protein
VLALAESSPLPLIALVVLGFLVGATGHLYRSRSAIVTGIGLILLGTIAVPLAQYLSDR